MQKSALCRSRRELSNEYLLAKFGFDTAENEPCKVSLAGGLEWQGRAEAAADDRPATGDGLSYDEWLTVLQQSPSPRLETLFTMFDLDNDGRMSAREFLATIEAAAAASEREHELARHVALPSAEVPFCLIAFKK